MELIYIVFVVYLVYFCVVLVISVVKVICLVSIDVFVFLFVDEFDWKMGVEENMKFWCRFLI